MVHPKELVREAEARCHSILKPEEIYDSLPLAESLKEI